MSYVSFQVGFYSATFHMWSRIGVCTLFPVAETPRRILKLPLLQPKAGHPAVPFGLLFSTDSDGYPVHLDSDLKTPDHNKKSTSEGRKEVAYNVEGQIPA